MISYQIYGIRAVSDVNLPELCPSSRNTLDAGKTVLARLKTERGINSDVGATFLKIDNPNVEEWLICARSSPRYVMRFVGLADFTSVKPAMSWNAATFATGFPRRS